MSSSVSVKKPLAINCEQVVKVLSGFIRTEVLKTGFGKVVLGLSGGIDSSLSAALAVRALGPANVIGVMMPYETSNPDSLADAELMTRSLGIAHRVLEITAMVKPFFEQNPEIDSVRRGNIMARMRMIVLYDVSAAEKALVLGTSNKTEYLLGYSTLWGDSACALNPLGDLYKTQVRALASYLELPERIIKKKPSADLWIGQTDEDELGFTYDQADAVLELLVDKRLSVHQAVESGFPADLVNHIMKVVRQTQYKRQMPLIAKLSNRTINRDFRFPRDWGL
ncbi:MAG: NAD(+) synthetase [Candidatus Glassbacteria bacterium RIFCSPLOWO2_12_FULL_58_11]|uniref:NH(3)-dependent NAD(+) synthetase n=2 Tax=Candidatus Glassiibacteriota TaxID=1817805 RepID=A0A1F5YMF5_9BACT|nr:MAG: NAD(+) synthetase [Candidatus Glassbacteria bacterium GWA2_58_10]OGG01147.1 MAG: NAD(+) synthetase [Candidatus Glassbacteria bacterium RIFCSPLOWO2_12_FULL_58_11]